MADNGKVVAEAIQPVHKTEREQILADNKDKSKWRWVSIPYEDLFGDPHTGVSINFEKYTPELNEEGQHTGRPGKYFVAPEVADEIERLLDMRLRSDMRVLQPRQDKELYRIQNRGGKPVAAQGAEAAALGYSKL